MCQDGCEYCKKTSEGSTCIKCSAEYAPKYKTGTTTIESCKLCSVLSNCNYCEVIGDTVTCLKSPCASKSTGTNKKFNFGTLQCSDNCPSDLSCSNQKSIVDEGGICYCRDCPNGSAVILSGSNAGICKSCGPFCQDCQLTDDKTNVICKTCESTKQFITVYNGVNTITGCYGLLMIKYTRTISNLTIFPYRQIVLK